jgi:hypothetical protein
MKKAGIEALSTLIVACMKIVQAVRAIFPKLDLGDIGHVIDIVRNIITAIGKLKESAIEVQDLEPDEMKTLAELVEYELEQQGIEPPENIGLMIEKFLVVFDAVLDFIKLLPHHQTNTER